uniref:TVP38/TMEM64 family protein n=1 Tax=uncultured Adlercreutzia sp. TaxID=875803 RepID=UPI0026F3AD88
QKLEAKAHEEKTVAGHPMPAADIFKFAGLIVFFVIMIIVCVALWPMIHELAEPGGIERVTTEVRNAGPWGFLILLAIQFLQIVVAFIPGEVVQVAAGMIYGPWVGALIIWIGCIISSSFIFVLVHKLGAPFVQAMVPEKYMGKFREWEKSPKFNAIVFILFLIPGLPKDVFTYLTPLTHMSMRSFVLISNFARIPGIVLSTYAASGLVTGDIAQSVAIFAVTAIVAVVALIIYSRITKKK